MTRNNLADHLAWLLRNVQLSKPVGPSLPNVHDAFDRSRGFDSASLQPVTGGPDARANAPQPVASSSSSTIVAEVDATIDDDLFADDPLERNTAVNRGSEQGMARLTTKSSRKPSLVSKQEQLLTPTPTAGVGRLQQAWHASLSKDDAHKTPSTSPRSNRIRTSSSVSRPKRPRPRKLTPEIHEDMDEEEPEDWTGVDTADPDVTASTAEIWGEDVLLWTEEHASRPEPLPKPVPPRGKKRKSSEISECVPKLKPKPKPKPNQETEAEDDDEFPDIFDLLDDDIRTPAMVKRRNAGFSSPRKSPPKLYLAASDTAVLTQRTVTQTVSTMETKIHRTASMDRTPHRGSSRVASKDDSPWGKAPSTTPPPQSARRLKTVSPANSTSKQRSQSAVAKDEESISDGDLEPQSPSSRPTRRFRRVDVIMDSDDEFQMSPTRDTSDTSFVTAASGSGPKKKRSPEREAGQEVGNAAIRSQSKQWPSSTSRDDSHSKRSSQARGCPDEMEVDEPIEEQKPGVVEPEGELHSSESDGMTFIMDMFLEQPHVLDGPMKAINERLAKNSAEFARSLREKWPPERKAQVKKEKEPLLKQKKAFSDVKTAHEVYKNLTVQKEELVAQIGQAYDASEDTEEAEARVDCLDKEIEDTEDILKQALAAAGINKQEMFHDLPDPAPQQPGQPGPAVQALQPMLAKPPPPISRDSTLIPECSSQVMMQTQSLSMLQSRVVSLERPPEVTRPPVPLFPREGPQSWRTATGKSLTKPSPHMPQEDQYMDDFIDDDVWAQSENLHSKLRPTPLSRGTTSTRSRSPAKLRQRHQDNHSDYGDGDDDLDAMVAMAEEAEDFEQRQSSMESRSHRPARSVLSETSANAGPTARVKAATKKRVKQVPKLKIPPELMKHPWSHDVLRSFKDRFRLEGFRHNQLEAINATLAGQDAFVLMPTGGGKSLCYQLPAVVNTGKTRGVTIVVTPLLSLMQDQVDHLTARGIIAKSFNGDMDRREKDDILQSFKLRNPEHHVQLLYVTPEMINKSTAFTNGLMTLWRNEKLARLVIDEAHCVSQWGHDFRPDYKQLGEVRKRFPGVPVMALTATATNNVIVDIKHNLSLENCKVFSQSFNRPNLYYEVRPKEKQPIDRIVDLINSRYCGMTGIVYTLSRKQTEQIANKLQDNGIEAAHYHAAMRSDEKTSVQRDWQAGDVKVVVATIAFGMGIDKPDVRFVIHHHIPKSLEGYYQETGRAGRDGLPSDCYLFFGHGDIYSLRKMIDDGEGSYPQKERQKEMLNRVVMFCENTRDCRRSQLLHYFGETFSADKCNKACDNCKIGGTFEVEDRTEYAKAALEAVMHHKRLTLNQCTDILRSTKKPGNDEEPQSFSGIAKRLKKPEVNSVIIRLAAEGALDEENRVGGGGVAIQYFILGREAASFMSGGRKLEVVVRTGGDKSAPAKATKKKSAKRKGTTEEPDEVRRPASTNVSSPIRRGARKSKKGKAVANYFDEEAIAEGDEDDDVDTRGATHCDGYEQDGFVVADDDEDDYFDPPVRPSVRQRRQRQRTLDELGPPISRTSGEDDVDDVHNDVADSFLEQARKLEEELRNAKGLRRVLFTEAQLRQMAVRWTTSLGKMRRIPGINMEHVDKYGPNFIPLILQYHGMYREIMGDGEEDTMAIIPATAGPSTTRHGQQKPGDVVDLVSDNDEEDDDGYEDPGVPSKYFATGGHDDPYQRDLDNWSDRFARTSQIEEPVSRGRGTSTKGPQGGKRTYYKKGEGGSRGGGRSYTGVSKRKGSTSAVGGNRRSSAGSSRGAGSKSTVKPSGGSSGGSKIGVMPY